MRLKEESNSWNARGIVRRDFRHTHGDPEIPKGKTKPKKKRPPKNRHKHVWVEVSFTEYSQYSQGRRNFPSWLYTFDNEPSYWAGFTTYHVCCDCLETKRKTNEGKRRAIYRRRYGRAW